MSEGQGKGLMQRVVSAIIHTCKVFLKLVVGFVRIIVSVIIYIVKFLLKLGAGLIRRTAPIITRACKSLLKLGAGLIRRTAPIITRARKSLPKLGASLIHEKSVIVSLVGFVIIALFTNYKINALGKQMKGASDVPISVIEPVQKASPLVKENARVKEFTKAAENKSLSAEQRDLLYVNALNHATDKDALLLTYIDFVSEQIAAFVKAGKADEALVWFDDLISTKDRALMNGTPENVLKSKTYNDKIDQVFDKHLKGVIDKQEKDEITEFLKGLNEEKEIARRVSNPEQKILLLSRIKQNADDLLANRLLSNKSVPYELISLLSDIDTISSSLLKEASRTNNEKLKNYQKSALAKIYSARKVIDDNPSASAFSNNAKKAEKDKEDRILSAAKSYLFVIDIGYLEESVRRIYQAEYDRAYNRMTDKNQETFARAEIDSISNKRTPEEGL